MPNTEKIRNALKEIKDPELDIDIVTLGLIRNIAIDDVGEHDVLGVEVTMTLTTPLCPFADSLIEAVEDTLVKLGFENARVELSFDPPWEPPADIRAMLGV
ncbi:MAG: metal-sulfur cluster assembly factor [Parcubacteria group bacterium]|nr:metal-sulfur cluster assembly factor [Parcubacteria group bacterium]